MREGLPTSESMCTGGNFLLYPSCTFKHTPLPHLSYIVRSSETAEMFAPTPLCCLGCCWWCGLRFAIFIIQSVTDKINKYKLYYFLHQSYLSRNHRRTSCVTFYASWFRFLLCLFQCFSAECYEGGAVFFACTKTQK